MRPLLRQDVPPAYPHVCIMCGHGAGPHRAFFIDLGFDISTLYNPLREGCVYVCNECAPAIVDGIIKIMNDEANRIMDNALVKEEAEYGTIDRITGGSELSGISASESSRPVSERLTDRGLIQGVGKVENLPDSHSGPDTSAGLGVLIATEPIDLGVDEPIEVPTFTMGKRVRNNRSGEPTGGTV